MRVKKATYIYFCVNIIGQALVCYFMHRIDERIQSMDYGQFEFGDWLYFEVTGLPVLAFCSIYSLFWAIKSGFEIFRRRSYQGLLALIVVSASWLSLFLIHRMMNG